MRDRKVTAAAGNDLPLPAADQLLISTGGMDCELVCREPIKRWTVAASASELTLDLTYRTVGVLRPLPDRYALPSEVRGSLVAGGRRIDIDGHGWRGHMWCEVDWSRLGTRVLGRFDDGDWLAAFGPPGAPEGVTVDTVGRTMLPAYRPDGSPVGVPRNLCRVTATDGGRGWGWLVGPW